MNYCNKEKALLTKAINFTNGKLALTHNFKKKTEQKFHGLGVCYLVSNGKKQNNQHTQITQESHTAYLDHQAVSLCQRWTWMQHLKVLYNRYLKAVIWGSMNESVSIRVFSSLK